MEQKKNGMENFKNTTGLPKKALTCHPDKNPNDPEKVDEFLTKAYDTLSDVQQRASYDLLFQRK